MTSLRIFLIGVLSAMGFVPQLHAAATVGEHGFVVGMCGHALTQEIDQSIPIDDQMALLKKAHIGVYRFPLAYRPNWEKFSKLLDVLDKNQIAPLVILFPPIHYENSTPEQVEKIAYDYALACAQHVKGRVGYWELGNELDGYSILKKGDTTEGGKIYTWANSPNGWGEKEYEPHRYQLALATLRGLARGIREGDPAAKTIVNSSGWVHVGYMDKLLGDHLDFDIIGWHWYSEDGDFRTVPGNFPLLTKLTSYHKPIWITEGNFRGKHTDEAAQEPKQADYLQKALAEFGDLYPIVQVYCVYTLFDEPFEVPYGVVQAAKKSDHGWSIGRTKPAFDVICNYENE